MGGCQGCSESSLGAHATIRFVGSRLNRTCLSRMDSCNIFQQSILERETASTGSCLLPWTEEQLTVFHSEQQKPHSVLVVLSAMGWKKGSAPTKTNFTGKVLCCLVVPASTGGFLLL